ncbi:PAS domain-containing protein [Roseiconus lacunae]|uniref:PAS domain-containing protein n=1 Tax=Roseiconus lacunae TaxID=2605694 RepID=A0ABT7PNE4_9BACT|nr:PAS domain-containing protein [Roseiconus lacunae]MCD0461594.1 PAS domain-containing protein [Roseiconus lacunae]MDM4017671.1 PAS domain-containing protein [Roseiconus lacunae]WRQ51067.1 PAS domain-containing protein [Stieleria sp. HD01]
MPDQLPIVTYAIDADDRLTDLNEQWAEFANLNDAGQSLHPESVLGKPIWDYVRDRGLQNIYRKLIERVRKTQERIDFAFRCDSPLFRRYMRMTIEGRVDGHVLFISRTESIVKRSEREQRLAHAFQGSFTIRQCSMCNLFQLKNGVWVEADQLVQRSDALTNDQTAMIIWAICPQCRKQMSNV